MKLTRRQGLKGLIGSVAAAALSAGGIPLQAFAQNRDRTLRHVMGGVVNSLDPTTMGSNRENFSMSVNIYDRLGSFGRNEVPGGYTFDMNQVRGELAERIDRSDDGLTFTFHLRDGATWHDGRPVTPQDVKWSLDRAVTAKTLAQSLFAGASMSAPDQFVIVGDRQVEVRLAKPDRLALPNLCTPFAAIFNSALAREHANPDDPWAIEWLKENTAAGGAYTVESHRAGQQITLRRNKAWKNGETGELPYFDRIIVQTVPEAATRANLLERGDADLAVDLAASDIGPIQERDAVQVFMTPQHNGFQAIVFGTQVAPFDDPAVRRAVAAALPTEAMFMASQFGRGRRLFGAQWSEALDATFPQPMPINENVDKAREMLKAAGHGDGIDTTFSFGTSVSVTAEPMAALIQEALGKIGVRVTVQKLPDAQFATLVAERKLPLFAEQTVAWLPSPDYFMRVFFSGDARWNYSGWQNQKVAELALAARYEIDQAVYDGHIKRFVDICLEDMPMALVWQASHDAVMAKGIRGYTYWYHRQADYRDLLRG
ncbi:peptide/nickel transport system substrate-binding protein [Aquamicrobium terrae]